MGLHVERIGEVALVVPEGMLKGGKETDELERTLRKLVHDNHPKILLDLGKVSHISSMPIGILASIHASAKRRGLHFALCNVGDRIENTLAIVKLLQVFDVYDSREQALEAFDKL